MGKTKGKQKGKRQHSARVSVVGNKVQYIEMFLKFLLRDLQNNICLWGFSPNVS